MAGLVTKNAEILIYRVKLEEA